VAVPLAAVLAIDHHRYGGRVDYGRVDAVLTECSEFSKHTQRMDRSAAIFVLYDGEKLYLQLEHPVLQEGHHIQTVWLEVDE
jgi:hypothetical protein